MATPKLLSSDTETPEEVSIATTLIPWRKDDNRARLMGYLACGFNIEEALYVLGLDAAWLEEQRQDDSFNAVELSIPEIRKELSREYIELDFSRNFRLVLEKDYRILNRSIHLKDGEVMNPQEHQYLLKMRSAYTPQQLQIMEQVMKGVGAEGFNLAKWIAEHQHEIREAGQVEFSRIDKVVVKGRPDGS